MHYRTRRTNRVLLAAVVIGSAAPALGQVINEDVKLLASDGEASDRFAISIAMDRGLIAVGAYYDDDNGSRSGSVYVYDAATGIQISKLHASDAAIGDWFGYSVDIDNGVVAVGAHINSDNGLGSGSAYLFNASTGVQMAKLLPTDGTAGDHFGSSIAISNGLVLVGAKNDDANGAGSGSAYLFDAASGTQISKLVSSNIGTFDVFGISVAIDNESGNGTAVVGAFQGGVAGSVYLFDVVTGTQIHELSASDGVSSDRFGWSVGIDNGVVVVGSPDDSHSGLPEPGSVYVFDAATGTQVVKIISPTPAREEEFGKAVSIDNGVLATGAQLDRDNGLNSGSAFLFDATTGALIVKLLPSDGALSEQFGNSIGIYNGTVAVGAFRDDANGSQSGSAYVFGAQHTICPADTNNDGVLTAADFTAWINAFNNQLPECDQNNDGSCTPADFTSWIANFNAGC